MWVAWKSSFSFSLVIKTWRVQEVLGEGASGHWTSAWLLGIPWDRFSLISMAKSPLSEPQLPLLLNWNKFPVNRWHKTRNCLPQRIESHSCGNMGRSRGRVPPGGEMCIIAVGQYTGWGCSHRGEGLDVPHFTPRQDIRAGAQRH